MKNYEKHDIESEKLAWRILTSCRKAKRARNLAVLGILAGSLSACGANVRLPSSQGYIHLEGDAKGVQAFFDGENGFITNGKASPDSTSAHWVARKQQEQEVTKREFAPSFLDKLMGNDVAIPTAPQKPAEETNS